MSTERAGVEAELEGGLFAGNAEEFLSWLVVYLRERFAAERALVLGKGSELELYLHTCASSPKEGAPESPVLLGDGAWGALTPKQAFQAVDLSREALPQGLPVHPGERFALIRLLQDREGRPVGVLWVGLAHEPEDLEALRLHLERIAPRAGAGVATLVWESDQALLVQATQCVGQPEFFHTLVRNLARLLNAHTVAVSELDPSSPETARTLALWSEGTLRDNVSYPLRGTPCQEVYDSSWCVIPEGVVAAYPEDEWLVELGAVSYVGIPFQDPSGRCIGHVAIVDDRPMSSTMHRVPLLQVYAALAGAELSRRRAEEARLAVERKMLEAQKLESLGMLAGGVAHDFNNLLVGITGHVSLALSEVAPAAPVREHLSEIDLTARRAADLARQMLAYSGKGRFVVESVHLSRLIEEMSHLLVVSLPKKVVLRYELPEELPLVHADATQMRQIAMNLVLNAADAIGERSGVISLVTGLLRAGSDYLAESSLGTQRPAGDYVFLEVSDTGCGMDPETQANIFDPFYTTKTHGRGLGLAAVQGIVEGHEGALKVYSELGKGSSFKLLLPVDTSGAQLNAPSTDTLSALPEGLRILVVDDEETVRTAAVRMLESLGLEVEHCEEGRSAIQCFERDPGRYDLVLLDMTMPGLSGVEVFRELKRLNADARVILTSGYNEQDATSRFAGKGLAGFVQKPFGLDELRAILAQVLEDRAD